MPSFTCVDTILDTLKSAQKDSQLDLKVGKDMGKDVKKLKRDLRFLRTFFLCAKKWGTHVSVAESSLSKIERDILQEFQSLCLKFDMKKAFSEFRKTICSFKEEISQMYMVLSDCFLQSCSASRNEVMELLDALLKNIADIFTWAVPSFEQELIKVAADLEETVNFMRSFVQFALLRGVKERELEPLLIHFEFVAITAARHSYVCWFDSKKSGIWRVPETERCLQISALRQSIRPVDAQVLDIYVRILTAANLPALSRTMRVEIYRYKVIVGDFVHSLLGNLWELLKSSFKDMFFMRNFYEGLTFLEAILKMQLEEFNELDYEIKDLIGSVVNNAGIMIFRLSVTKMTKRFTKEMEVSVLEFAEKVEHIKSKIAGKYPATSSTSKFLTFNELSFMDNLIDDLKELQKCRVDASAFVKDRIAMMEEGLVFLRSFLNNSMEQRSGNKNLQTLSCRIMKVAHKAESIIDSLMVEVVPDSSPFLLDTIIEEIKRVKKALAINDNRHDFEVPKSTNTYSHGVSQGSTSVINDVVVGFDDEAKGLIHELTRTSKAKQLGTIAIVGMPGLGKTTFAQNVYSNPSTIEHFHIRAWCCVSHRKHMKDILLDILVCIVPNLCAKYSQMTKDELFEVLRKRLKGKTYLVVLDDVWESNTWNALETSFPDDGNGSRTLITTRNHKLAYEVNPKREPYFLRRFNDDESLELLRKKLFLDPYERTLLVKQIAKNCNGLPLTIVIVAGLLSNTKQEGWIEIAKRISSSAIGGTEQCMSIFELSYENLPDHLKTCLLYFGAFSEDQEIPVWRLSQLWIAEGFVENSQEDLAEGYVMDLVGRSLLMVTKRRSTGGVKTCRIHDLLHEFCVTKAKEGTFLHSLRGKDELHNFNGPFNLRRLCIYSKPEHFEKSRLFCPRLRCLLFFADSKAELINLCSFSFLFHIFKLLWVLDLETFDLGEVFPCEVLFLVQLRYLAIAGRMQSIPSTFSNLLNLETFLVKGCHESSSHFQTSFFEDSRCVFLPITLWDMVKLRHLQASGTFLGFTLALDNLENSPDLNNLHTFVAPIFSGGNDMENKLRKIPNIQRLKCQIEEFPRGCSQIVEMDFLSQLSCVKLCFPKQSTNHVDLRFPSKLTKLTLSDFSWITISTIGELPNLKVLKLVRSSGGKVWHMEEEVAFPNLIILKLHSLRISTWTGFGDHFPCLQRLVLRDFYRLTEVPDCLREIATLDRIELHNCSDSVERLMREIGEEQSNSGNEHLKIFKHRF